MIKSSRCGLVLLLALGFALAPSIALANKVDCTKVMSEVNSGKKTKAIADDLKISTSSVYRCKKKAHYTTKPSTKMTPVAAGSPAPMAHH
ncbi:MAG TPA: hypothetical protein VJN94_16365 [Candidatus Binataceae bacterium]|nr:hypothetical protein [Candidatus Binataceae bacterium]